MQQLVITAVGADRPGLVEEFSGCLLDAGANLADSRMVNLRGQFALIILAEAPGESIDAIQQAVEQTAQRIGLTVSIVPQTHEPAAEQRAGLPLRLRTSAMDQPGIVHRITRLLYSHGINIEELETRLQPGSYTGTPLFSLDLRMTLPPDVQLRTLRAELDQLDALLEKAGEEPDN